MPYGRISIEHGSGDVAVQTLIRHHEDVFQLDRRRPEGMTLQDCPRAIIAAVDSVGRLEGGAKAGARRQARVSDGKIH